MSLIDLNKSWDTRTQRLALNESVRDEAAEYAALERRDREDSAHFMALSARDHKLSLRTQEAIRGIRNTFNNT